MELKHWAGHIWLTILAGILFRLTGVVVLCRISAGAAYAHEPEDTAVFLSAEQLVDEFVLAKASNDRFRVESLKEFAKIKAWYGSWVNDGQVVHDFQGHGGEYIQCVVIASQGAVLATGQDPSAIPLSPEVLPGDFSGTSQDVDALGQVFGLDGSVDAKGKERRCPAGTFPRLVHPEEVFYTYKKFEDIFQKYPEGQAAVIPDERLSAVLEHQWAFAYRTGVDNQGLAADFNIWHPEVEKANEFSLAQLWVIGGVDSAKQSVETGWQVLPSLYGDAQAHLFIYSTSDNYQTGCYNLLCGRFIQTDSSVVIGGALTSYSRVGGTQYSLKLAVYHDQGGSHDWWLRVNDTWVGYYPNSLFVSAGLAMKASKLEYGGEIIDKNLGNPYTRTDMGSGRFPSDGFGYAAYIKRCRYYDMLGAAYTAAGLSVSATAPELWDVGPVIYSSDENWGAYFFFGGPGNTEPQQFSWGLFLPALLHNRQ